MAISCANFKYTAYKKVIRCSLHHTFIWPIDYLTSRVAIPNKYSRAVIIQAAFFFFNLSKKVLPNPFRSSHITTLALTRLISLRKQTPFTCSHPSPFFCTYHSLFHFPPPAARVRSLCSLYFRPYANFERRSFGGSQAPGEGGKR